MICRLKIYVAYFLGLFSFVSFSVCCDMTLGAAVCHASYEMNMLCYSYYYYYYYYYYLM